MPPTKPIRFVHEQPDIARPGPKKKARLVTACDACRHRKVRCAQSGVGSTCDTCRDSGTECTYEGRDRFHGANSNTAKTANSGNMSTHSKTLSHHTSSDNLILRFSIFGFSSPDIDGELRRLPTFARHFGPTSSIHGRETPSPSQTPSSGPSRIPSQTRIEPVLRDIGASGTRALFDPNRDGYPHPNLFEHLLGIFFDSLAMWFPFLSRETITNRARSATLSAVLANSIAGLSSRFSERPELANGNQYAKGNPYTQMAKTLIVQTMATPSTDLLHAMILIAWVEYGHAHDREFFIYGRMAVAMLLDLNLAKASTAELASSEVEKDMMKFTWWSVANLDVLSSWVTGRTSALRDHHFDVTLPSADALAPSGLSTTLMFAYLCELCYIHKDLLNSVNAESNDGSRISTSITIKNLQTRLKNFQILREGSMSFNEENYRTFSECQQGALFLNLHVYYNALNAFIHWPSLFANVEEPVAQSVRTACLSARAIVDALRVAQSLDPSSIARVPFFDIPLSVAIKVLSESSNDDGVEASVMVLNHQATYWRGAALLRDKLLLEFPSLSGLIAHSGSSVNSPSSVALSTATPDDDEAMFTSPTSHSNTLSPSSELDLLSKDDFAAFFNVGNSAIPGEANSSNTLVHETAQLSLFSDFFTNALPRNEDLSDQDLGSFEHIELLETQSPSSITLP